MATQELNIQTYVVSPKPTLEDDLSIYYQRELKKLQVVLNSQAAALVILKAEIDAQHP